METIEDILREMRRQADTWIEKKVPNFTELADHWLITADRIEAATAELRDENAKLKADLMVKYQRCYCSRLASAESDNIRFKAALKPVLDIVMDDATSDLSMEMAIDEAKRVYKEGASK